jgi:hypothetical protein
MSLQDAERARTRHAQRSHQKQVTRRRSRRQHRPAPALPAILHDSQILTVRQWCALGGFSPRTGARILKSGSGPVVTQLSDKRVGIAVAAHKAWIAARARPTSIST